MKNNSQNFPQYTNHSYFYLATQSANRRMNPLINTQFNNIVNNLGVDQDIKNDELIEKNKILEENIKLKEELKNLQDLVEKNANSSNLNISTKSNLILSQQEVANLNEENLRLNQINQELEAKNIKLIEDVNTIKQKLKIKFDTQEEKIKKLHEKIRLLEEKHELLKDKHPITTRLQEDYFDRKNNSSPPSPSFKKNRYLANSIEK